MRIHNEQDCVCHRLTQQRSLSESGFLFHLSIMPDDCLTIAWLLPSRCLDALANKSDPLRSTPTLNQESLSSNSTENSKTISAGGKCWQGAAVVLHHSEASCFHYLVTSGVSAALRPPAKNNRAHREPKVCPRPLHV